MKAALFVLMTGMSVAVGWSVGGLECGLNTGSITAVSFVAGILLAKSTIGAR